MHDDLAVAQATTYALEFGRLYADERAQRRLAEQALVRLEEAHAATVHALATALELRDDVTGGHAERVTRLAMALARRAAPDLAADPHLPHAFVLHDVGKIGIPDAVLQKPGPLDEAEQRLMQTHTVLGERIVSDITHLGVVVREVVGAHHERWDGLGYPYATVGRAIPCAARIFAFADAYDAMTNDRPYRRALSRDAALAEIRRGAGRQFDPRLVEQFIEVCLDLFPIGAEIGAGRPAVVATVAAG